MPILSHIFCSFSDKSSELQLIFFNSHLILSFFALTSLANSVEVGCGILEEIKPNATMSLTILGLIPSNTHLQHYHLSQLVARIITFLSFTRVCFQELREQNDIV